MQRKALIAAARQYSTMPLTNSLGRSLNAIAPSLAVRLRNIWYTLNGGRFDTLAGALEERMYGHRQHFDDRIDRLEARVDDRVNRLEARVDDRVDRLDACGARLERRSARHSESHGTFMLPDTLARLEARGAAPGRAIAVVSVLPPQQTGIANYTLCTFEASPVPVDVFSPFDTDHAYLAASRRLPQANGPLEVFALEALPAALAMRDYTAVIWVLGNSHHHLPVIRLMREMRHLDPLSPTWVQLHDPVLFNLARLHAEEADSDLAAMLQPLVPEGIPDADWAAASRGDVRSILTHPGLAVRALLAGVPLHGAILHSHAARDLILRDWPELAVLQQRLLYLPVAESFRPRPWTSGPAPRIGSFGYPSAFKGTDLIVAAFRRLRQAQPGATLVIAGYHAAAYAGAQGLAGEPGIEVNDNPPMPRLVELMRGVDVAIQLRTLNLGESSGVVPQLLSLDVPTITTAIGAFAEYGEAVRDVPIGSSAEDILVAALEEAADPARRSAARRRYVETHGPRDFCAALLDAPQAA
jgi:hypothetical protein